MAETLHGVAKIVMGQSPPGETCNAEGIGLPLLNGPTEFGSHHPVPAQFTTDARKIAEPGDLLFCVRGSTTGRMNWADQRYAIGRGIAAIRHNGGLGYQPLLRGVIEQQLPRLLAAATGSTFPNVSSQMLAELAMPELEQSEQLAASEILAALDDKIKLNRQSNATLEAMAQAIFRDWFVDFGPVHRKQAGATEPLVILGGLISNPAQAAITAAPFPSVLSDDGIPTGWRLAPLIEQASWVNGAAYKKMHFVSRSEGLPVVKIAELKAGVTATTAFTNTDLGGRYRIDDGELLFSWSGNPDTSIDTFIWTGGPAWLNQHIFAVRPNGSRSLGYLYTVLKFLNPTFAEIARDKQTTGLGHVTKEDLKRLEVVVPPRGIETAFDALMTPIFLKIQATMLENRTLAETRDYLLPRLMSGAVRVGGGAAEVTVLPLNAPLNRHTGLEHA